jgi:hypothetical protein
MQSRKVTQTGYYNDRFVLAPVELNHVRCTGVTHLEDDNLPTFRLQLYVMTSTLW